MIRRIVAFVILSIFLITILGCSNKNNGQVEKEKVASQHENKNQTISNSKSNETTQNNTNTVPTQTPIQNQQQSNNSSEIKTEKSDQELASEYTKDFIIKVITAWQVKDIKKSEFKDILDYYDGYIFPANVLPTESFKLDRIRGISVDKIIQSDADPNSFLVLASSLFNAKSDDGEYIFTYRGEHTLALKKINNKFKLQRIVQWNYFNRTFSE